jgi:(1->4)-alpha-D-glucan 1-alpha-D-glucosylmutase
MDLQRTVALYGACNGLSQLLLKGTAPGVPDFYQGTELWSLTLVDPDNRRPVDWDVRRRFIEALREPSAKAVAELLRTWQDGRIKLHVTTRILQHRLAHPELYRQGDYLPLHATGGRRPHVCGFARRQDDDQMLCLAPRRVLRIAPQGELPLGKAWGESLVELPPGSPERWRNVLTGEVVGATVTEGRAALQLKKVFATLPLALLEPAERP